MKNTITYCLLVLLPLLGMSQKLVDRNANARFYSSTPVEDIEAENNKALGALDMANGQVAVSMQMKDFKFEKSLMQEHFNENYIESDKYPKATFTGLLEGFDLENVNTSSDALIFPVSGQMTIHGVTNDLDTEVKMIMSEGKLQAETEFVIRIADYDIEIPKVVILNIAEEVEVTARFTFDLP
jgi:polyisoprenoid-binding protein YceI